MRILTKHIDPTPVIPSHCQWSAWNDLIDVDDQNLVIFNTMAQTAVLMHKSEHLPIDELPEASASLLFSLGMIVPIGTDEHAIVEQQFATGKNDMSYIDLTILLTRQCQFRCVYCFEGTKKEENLEDRTSDDLLAFLEDQSSTLKKLRVTWFGGEPLIAYPMLKRLSERLMSFCEKHHVQYTADMVTNGYALSKERCHELCHTLNIRRYIITLDGPSGFHDRRRPLRSGLPTFDKIWENITTLVDMGAFITIRMTIDKENVHAIPALLDEIARSPFARKVGLSFCRTMDYGFTPDTVKSVMYTDKEFADIEWDLIQYAHRLKMWQYRFPHSAPLGGCLRKGDIVMGTKGEIYKCLDTVGDQQWESGNISGNALEKVPAWYERWLSWSPSQSASCRKCVLQPLCNGGCPHNAIFTDKKHGTATQCPEWKANYQRQIIELAREYLKNTIPYEH